ncbi:hypothetical protein J2S40_004514 [Nocardioides luteus]|uniref:Uncharacterized protein n=1 Tax=Nocardioides luteus TaxID=1844 RepID=A0ABQ5SRV9_9ACTN|nr:hypothetical protein [Nocardioides luteus]MDR7313456.1 hypothetical protein [Nocardioides luteus]GGR60984.1 hypothetical protein GCM10010197_30200 [Nocardioides luteus]GLJ66521.1 hypothetical protein GCM10017579_05570 [Nocardioides luteus]
MTTLHDERLRRTRLELDQLRAQHQTFAETTNALINEQNQTIAQLRAELACATEAETAQARTAQQFERLYRWVLDHMSDEHGRSRGDVAAALTTHLAADTTEEATA